MPEENKREKIAIVLLVSIFLLIPTLGITLNSSSGTILLAKEFQEKKDTALPQEASDDSHQVRVIKNNAVLRLKPKGDAVVISKLPLGALLDVKEQIDDWFQISLPPDKDGFVVTGYLHKSFTEPSSIIHK
jgi:hypothetical protein